jgi:bifunctional oligoribonuclease and PAP phosphatase NrnA
MQEWWDQLQKRILSAGKIGILTHKDPDGDGLAAALVLKRYLDWKHIDSNIILEEHAPQTYNFLDADKMTIVWTSYLSFDMLIVLDCHETTRLGICSTLLEKAKHIFAADHHIERETIPNSLNWIDSYAVSVGTMLHKYLYKEILTAPHELQEFYAKCIYTTILNDTDNFVNSNTDITAYQTAADLIHCGLKPAEIAMEFLFNKPPSEMKFVGEVLATIETHKNGKVLFLDSTLEMLQRNGLNQSATTKLTRWVKGIQGVEVVVYFRELETRAYRLSLRSVHTPVNTIAELYGGGGHIVAAGCTINGTLLEVKEMILKNLSML